jgi:hypothetical protein
MSVTYKNVLGRIGSKEGESSTNTENEPTQKEAHEGTPLPPYYYLLLLLLD